MRVRGAVRPPGDKSISHRALLLAALARGRSELAGLLTGADVMSTARVLRQLGVEVSPIRDGSAVTVDASRITHPASRLHCGNSGTTARLLLGILAGQRFPATLTGDASLRRRPMRRVTEPLRAMGAHIKEERGDSLPLTIRGGRLRDFTYTSPVASAQVKSALLFAGLVGGVSVTVREPYLSRDHTERLLVHLGLALSYHDGAISFRPAAVRVPAFQLSVPGDASSAAFLVAAAVLAEGGELLIENVGVNPTRTGFLIVLGRMGARVERLNLRDEGGEPVADLLVRPAALRATEVAAAEVPAVPYGTWELLRKGKDCAILAVGVMCKPALEAAELLAADGFDVSVVNARFLKPMDREMLDALAQSHKLLVTVEDGTVVNGFGAALAALVQTTAPDVRVVALGVPDRTYEHAPRAEQLADVGLTGAGIAARIRALAAEESLTTR